MTEPIRTTLFHSNHNHGLICGISCGALDRYVLWPHDLFDYQCYVSLHYRDPALAVQCMCLCACMLTEGHSGWECGKSVHSGNYKTPLRKDKLFKYGYLQIITFSLCPRQHKP